MSNGIRWDPSYSVGIAALDEEHKRLLTLGNAVVEAATQEQAQAAVARLLECMEEEAIRHFASEEALMRESRYPLLAEHHAKHDRLTAELRLFTKQYKADHLGPVSLSRFLIDWMVNHILVEDKKFQAFREGAGDRQESAGAATSGAPPA